MPIPTPKGESLEETAHNLLLEKGYTTRVSLGGGTFGGLKAPEYARDYELKLVGNRSLLPRGTLVGGTRHEPDPAFFKRYKQTHPLTSLARPLISTLTHHLFAHHTPSHHAHTPAHPIPSSFII